MTDIITLRAVECMKYGKAITPLPSKKIPYQKPHKFDRSKILNLFQQKMSCKDIAKAMGCTVAHVQRVVYKTNTRHPWTYEQIADLLRRGNTIKLTAEKCGCGITTVKKVKFEMNRTQADDVRSLAAEGFTFDQIKKKLKVNIGVVKQSLRRAGK